MAFKSQGYSGSDDYIASRALMEIVNVAVGLGKPLVVKGSRDRKDPARPQHSQGVGQKALDLEYQIHDQSQGWSLYLRYGAATQ